eukprot:COSAG05_NODE_2933_length_2489_cov_18.007531_1_plen_680_part_10
MNFVEDDVGDGGVEILKEGEEFHNPIAPTFNTGAAASGKQRSAAATTSGDDGAALVAAGTAAVVVGGAAVASSATAAIDGNVAAKTAKVSKFGKIVVILGTFVLLITTTCVLVLSAGSTNTSNHKKNQRSSFERPGSGGPELNSTPSVTYPSQNCSHMPTLDNIKRSAISCPSGKVGVRVIVMTDTRANEYTLKIDKIATYGKNPKFKNKSRNIKMLCLDSKMKHTVSTMDAYGDGWHCGYWAVEDQDGQLLKGGPVEGRVQGYGGEVQFQPSGGSVAPAKKVIVTIVSKLYAQDISWNIDDGQTFPGKGKKYDNNKEYTMPIKLSEGKHVINFFDSYGDGWKGGYWKVSQNGKTIGGGEIKGQVTGSGGEASFCVTCCQLPCHKGDSANAGQSAKIQVIIQPGTHPKDVTWNIDSGQHFGHGTANEYKPMNQVTHELTIDAGKHTINYFDSYGDGWIQGYWEVKHDGKTVAGGPDKGVVTGNGGMTEFCIGSGCIGGEGAKDNVPIVIAVTTKNFAEDISWHIDGSSKFGIDPKFRDNHVEKATLRLPEGAHTFYYQDHYGAGWSGGYWTITGCDGRTIAGGAKEGKMDGHGGEATFTVKRCAPPPPSPPEAAPALPPTNMDCAGVPNGKAKTDKCGKCNGDDSSCKDCAGVPNGKAKTDKCGKCNGDDSSCKDCAGVP